MQTDSKRKKQTKNMLKTFFKVLGHQKDVKSSAKEKDIIYVKWKWRKWGTNQNEILKLCAYFYMELYNCSTLARLTPFAEEYQPRHWKKWNITRLQA